MPLASRATSSPYPIETLAGRGYRYKWQLAKMLAGIRREWKTLDDLAVNKVRNKAIARKARLPVQDVLRGALRELVDRPAHFAPCDRFTSAEPVVQFVLTLTLVSISPEARRVSTVSSQSGSISGTEDSSSAVYS